MNPPYSPKQLFICFFFKKIPKYPKVCNPLFPEDFHWWSVSCGRRQSFIKSQHNPKCWVCRCSGHCAGLECHKCTVKHVGDFSWASTAGKKGCAVTLNPSPWLLADMTKVLCGTGAGKGWAFCNGQGQGGTGGDRPRSTIFQHPFHACWHETELPGSEPAIFLAYIWEAPLGRVGLYLA